MALEHPRCKLRHFVDDGQAGADPALGIVFVRLVGAEHGQQAVPGVLQYAALLHLDDGRQAFEHAVHHGMHVFGVELARHVGRADHVHEQHRHRLEPLFAPAGQRLCRRQPVAQGRDRHVGDHIAEHRTLGIECGNGRFNLFRGVVHCVRDAVEAGCRLVGKNRFEPRGCRTTTTGFSLFRGSVRPPGFGGVCTAGFA